MLGLRLDGETEARLARVARRQGRSKSDIARDALRLHLARLDDDSELVAEMRRIASLVIGEDLSFLDENQADLEELLAEEEAAAARRAA